MWSLILVTFRISSKQHPSQVLSGFGFLLCARALNHMSKKHHGPPSPSVRRASTCILEHFVLLPCARQPTGRYEESGSRGAKRPPTREQKSPNNKKEDRENPQQPVRNRNMRQTEKLPALPPALLVVAAPPPRYCYCREESIQVPKSPLLPPEKQNSRDNKQNHRSIRTVRSSQFSNQTDTSGGDSTASVNRPYRNAPWDT